MRKPTYLANEGTRQNRIDHLVRSFNDNGDVMCLACRVNECRDGSEWCDSCLDGLRDADQFQLEREIKHALANPHLTPAAHKVLAFIHEVHDRYGCVRRISDKDIAEMVRESCDKCSVCRERPATCAVFKNPLRIGGMITKQSTVIACDSCAAKRNEQIERYIAKHQKP